MAGVKVPSIQHAAGIWDPRPEAIARKLLSLATKAPPFSYQNLYLLASELLTGGSSYDQVERATHGVRHPLARKNYLEILPLLRIYADGIKPCVVGQIAPRNYSVGRDLRVLVNPPIIYYKDANSYLPWFIFWKRNLLNDLRSRLFITMMREVIDLDPDLEGVSLSLVICSERAPKEGRELSILDASSINPLSRIELIEMLKVFAAGYAMAVTAHAVGNSLDQSDILRDDGDEDQPDLFA